MKRLLTCVVCGVICGLFFMPAGVATATELIWVPINPSFGGSPYNAEWLMASAQAQNEYEEESDYSYETDPLADFEDSLKRQYLYALSRKIMEEAFGEEDVLQPGQTILGDYSIDVTTNGMITVVITNLLNGNTTTVEIPYY